VGPASFILSAAPAHPSGRVTRIGRPSLSVSDFVFTYVNSSSSATSSVSRSGSLGVDASSNRVRLQATSSCYCCSHHHHVYVSYSYSSTPSRGCGGFFVYIVGMYCTLQVANKINLRKRHVLHSACRQQNQSAELRIQGIFFQYSIILLLVIRNVPVRYHGHRINNRSSIYI
jgi:hypothetical protein